MVWAAWRMRSSTSAAASASRTSSSADWSRATVRLCPFARTIGLVSLTIARWPLCWMQLRHGPGTYTTRRDATLGLTEIAMTTSLRIWRSCLSYEPDPGLPPEEAVRPLSVVTTLRPMKPCVVEFDPGKLHTLLISGHLPRGMGLSGVRSPGHGLKELLTSARQPVTAKGGHHDSRINHHR